MEPVEIRADGLLLRTWRPGDADAVYRACQDPDVQRWTSVPSPYRPEHAIGFVGEQAARWLAAGTAVHLGVFDAGDGGLLGSCALTGLTDRSGAEFGYWTAPWARGRGVAERASRALLRWGFESFDLPRVGWRANVGNHVSLLVALRLGVRIEGVLRAGLAGRDGGRADCWLGALLPGELTERPPADDPVLRRTKAFAAGQPTLTAGADPDRITLRPPAERDLDSMVASCRDPESVRWTTVPAPYERTDAEFYVRDHAPRQWALGAGAVFVIADPTGAHAGTIDLRLSPTDPAVGDVGFLVAPWARGRGCAPAALRALAEWGIGTLGLHRVEWRANVGNSASRRAAEKAGFTIEGAARAAGVHRGARVDQWTGALLRDDLR